MNATSPIVDLTALPVDLQAIECHYRLERGKVHLSAIKVRFRMNKIARDIAFSNWYNGQFFLAT